MAPRLRTKIASTGGSGIAAICVSVPLSSQSQVSPSVSVMWKSAVNTVPGEKPGGGTKPRMKAKLPLAGITSPTWTPKARKALNVSPSIWTVARVTLKLNPVATIATVVPVPTEKPPKLIEVLVLTGSGGGVVVGFCVVFGCGAVFGTGGRLAVALGARVIVAPEPER